MPTIREFSSHESYLYKMKFSQSRNERERTVKVLVVCIEKSLRAKAERLRGSMVGSKVREIMVVVALIRALAAPKTVPHQAPPSMRFPRQEYWFRLPFPSPRVFPTQR